MLQSVRRKENNISGKSYIPTNQPGAFTYDIYP